MESPEFNNLEDRVKEIDYMKYLGIEAVDNPLNDLDLDIKVIGEEQVGVLTHFEACCFRMYYLKSIETEKTQLSIQGRILEAVGKRIKEMSSYSDINKENMMDQLSLVTEDERDQFFESMSQESYYKNLFHHRVRSRLKSEGILNYERVMGVRRNGVLVLTDTKW